MKATVPAPAGRRTQPVAYGAPTWPAELLCSVEFDACVWAETLLASVRTCAGDGTRFMAGCAQ